VTRLVAGMSPKAIGDFTRAQTAEALEDGKGSIEALTGRRTRQDELGGMAGVANGIGHCDEAAEGVAHHDWAFDFERVTKGPYVVGPMVQRPAVARGAIATALAAMVEVDQLGNLGKR